MSTISHFLPKVPINLICCKGGSHEEQALNLVCLDPLCRGNCLICSVCWTETHKYHKVVGLDKFIDEYKRNIGSANNSKLAFKISKSYSQIKDNFSEFKTNINSHLLKFEKSIEKYAEYLFSQTQIRDIVSEQLNIELEPENIKNIRSLQELEKSLTFILNNSFFDANSNMVNSSEILKQNEERICALIDKMDYMTKFCEKIISESLEMLNFAKHTLHKEKIELSEKIDNLNSLKNDPTSLKTFMVEKKSLSKILESTGSLILSETQKIENSHEFESLNLNAKNIDHLFSKHRHPKLSLEKNGKILKSSINAQKPQFGLAWPDINIQPKEIKEWNVRVNKCRDFSSESVLALGIAKLSDMKLANFEGKPTNCLMINSAGFVTLNNKIERTNFTFREGDTLYFKYDPHYNILEISKSNGRTLTLTSLGCNEPVYPCVRFTYATDEVQFV